MKPYFPSRAVPAAAPRRAGAFSLVITLIIVSMLAVVAIGFLASMSSERTTADAFGNKTRAEQAAQAGVDSAMAILREAFKDFPDSATVWENHSVNKDVGTSVAPYNEGTTLYVRALANGNQPDPNADNRPGHATMPGEPDSKATDPTTGMDKRNLFVLPLISGTQYQPADQLFNWTSPQFKPAVNHNSVNANQLINPTKLDKRTVDDIGYAELNVLRYKGDTQGWLGSPPTTNGTARVAPRTTRVPWVEVRQADATSPNTGPIMARYAFWVEDESFRTNVNYAGLGNAPGSETRDRLDNAASAAPTPAYPTVIADSPVNAGTSDLFAMLRMAGDSSSQSVTAAQSLFNTRKRYPANVFPEALGFSHTSELSSNLSDQLRFLTTTTSSGLNISRHGSQRVNLNELEYRKSLPDGTTPLQYDPQVIIDQIVATVQFHAPNFGQRFYRLVSDAKSTSGLAGVINNLSVSSSQTTNHTLIYLYKIATNIHDYMDADPRPTFVDGIKNTTTGIYKGIVHHGIYPAPIDPMAPIYPQPDPNGTGNLIWAQGKDSAPYIDECAVRFAGGPDSTHTTYELDADYYIEVWNPTTRDVAASNIGHAPRIRVISAPTWQASTGYVISSAKNSPLTNPSPGPGIASPQRDYDIDLTGVVFPAGKATVITTDKNFASHGVATGDTLNNFHYCPILSGSTVYKGMMPSDKSYPYITLVGRQPSPSSDYDTEVILYSDEGYIDCAPGCMPIYSGTGANYVYLPKATPANLIYGGSLRGNGGTAPYTPTVVEPSMTGDPRSNNEPLQTNPSYTGSEANSPRYYNFSAGTAGTLGLPNTDFAKPENDTGLFTAWPDYYKFPDTVTLASTDGSKAAAQAPVFIADSPLTSIGQLGDIYDPARYSGAKLLQARGGGRSLRIGQAEDLWDGNATSASRSWTSWRLTDFFCISDALQQPGLININGVARDNGAALRAALTGFKFQDKFPTSRGDPITAKNALSVDPGLVPGVDTLVSQIENRLTPSSATAAYAPYNTGQGPFFERGEFSELPAFGRTVVAQTFPPVTQPTGDLVAGVNMSTQVFDRGREEIFRRLAEMITTRGNVFTVYAVGQALSPLGKVTSTQRLKVTFRLVPKTDNSTGAETKTDFHPATKQDFTSANLVPIQFNPTDLTRFDKPHHYDIEILSASKGGG